MSENNLLNAALLYARAGFRVFPLEAKGKKPLVPKWKENATTDEKQIRSLWAQYPSANIGLATGENTRESGLFLTVIDLDNKPEKNVNGFKTLYEWQQENGALPETISVKTGSGGFHFYYFTEKRYSIGADILGTGSGVDFRASGGYVVAPPSVHKNGNCYEWQSEFKPENIARADSLLEKLLTKEKKTPAPRAVQSRTFKAVTLSGNPADRAIQRLGLSFGIGARNDNLFKLTASMQASGFADEVILSELERVNKELCTEPLPANELQTIAKSALERYAKGHPHDIAAAGSIEACEERLKSEDFPYIIPQVKNDGTIKYSIDCPLLAKYVREHDNYFFIETKGNNPPVFWYENGFYRHIDDNTFKGKIKRHIERFDERLIETKHLDETFKLLLTDGQRVSPDPRPENENLICLQNGVLDITSGRLLPHSPDYLFTNQIPCNWTYNRGEFEPKCPRFDEFLNTLTSGDKDVINLLWEYIGLTISNVPGYRPKQALILYGAGNTGKSQLLELLRRLVGDDNFAYTDIQDIEERFNTAPLFGKRLAGSGDMSAMRVREVKMFKMITGGDSIGFEFKGKDKFQGRFYGTLLFCTNELPKFGGDKGEQVYLRMLIVPCNNVIPEEKRDRQLIEKLYAEREGIVYKAVCGLIRLINRGHAFNEPEACKRARASYEVENDNALQFLEECTLPREVLRQQGINNEPTTTGEMYKAYSEWTKTNGFYTNTRSEFKKAICRKYNVKTAEELEIHKQQRYYKFDLVSADLRRELLGYC